MYYLLVIASMAVTPADLPLNTIDVNAVELNEVITSTQANRILYKVRNVEINKTDKLPVRVYIAGEYFSSLDLCKDARKKLRENNVFAEKSKKLVTECLNSDKG